MHPSLRRRPLDAEPLDAGLGQRDQHEPGLDESPQPRRDETEQRLELELARERVTDLVQRFEMAQPTRRGFVQPRVLDRNGRLCSKKLCQFLVFVGEVAAARLLGQVQVPVRHPAKQNGYPQEGLHRGVVRREPDRARVVAEIGEPKGLRLSNEDAENPSSSWKIADRGMGLRPDASRQEALEAVTRAIDDSQCRVPSAGQLRSGLDELLEKRIERELRAQGDTRVDEDAQAVERSLL